MNALVTDRLTIQLFTHKNITKEYLSWINDKNLMKFSNQRFVNHSENTASKYLSSFKDTSNYFFALYTSSSKKFIGTMTVYISKPHSTADLGILIGDNSAHGLGYGLEAWEALIDWLFNIKRIRKITAGCMEVNQSMLSIMKKSGMIMEAVKLDQELYQDEYVNLLFFRKFADEHYKK